MPDVDNWALDRLGPALEWARVLSADMPAHRARSLAADQVYLAVSWVRPGLVKVGVTSDPRQRVGSLGVSVGAAVSMFGVWRVGAGRAHAIETRIKRALAQRHVGGEWFAAPNAAALVRLVSRACRV